MTAPFRIGFLLFPRVTQLDMTGPAQLLARMRNSEVFFVWKTLDPVPTDAGFSIVPTATFESCPPLDMVCVPGGGGMRLIMDDEEMLEWLRLQGRQAKYVTSVCSGSLLLGAAGLMTGYKAGAHWLVRDELRKYGATPVAQRVVKDRNRITGGGVTAGIDFALAIIEEIRGAEEAKAMQLMFEYDPQPPYACGTPDKASPETIARATAMILELRDEAVRAARPA